MSSRFNNKRLLYLLAGLIALLILTVLIKIPKESATLKSMIVEFDTAEVNKIIIYPRVSNGKAVEFFRNGGKWNVQQGDIVALPQEGSVRNIFGEILSIKPQSLAAVNKSKWKEFELTDSLGTRIKFLNKKGKTLADLMIGKISYKPQENPYGGYGGNNMQVSSFVRLYDEQKVYTVDGLLSFSFNVKFDDWRDKTFIKSQKNDIMNISFTYPADSSFILTKKGNIWQVGNQVADSASVENYLISLGSMNGESFRDKYSPISSPVYQLLIEGNNLLKISIKCFKDETKDDFIINSSLNSDVYFSMKKEDLFGKLLKPQKYFTKKIGKR
jgi:hypothetical protein